MNLAASQGLLILAAVVAGLIGLPVASVLAHVFDGGTSGVWRHLAATVLPEYVGNTLWLCLGVGAGTVAVGVSTAWLTAMHRFPGSRIFEWALVLPLAVPAYVLAYVYTDFLQFAGPVQSALREAFGWTRADYFFPEVRSLGGAIVLFVFVLYPYVYLTARVAFIERAGGMLEAARTLGLGPWRSFLRVSVPLARPAVAAGTVLALMETLADYGAVSYFGVQTFTTGIYRAWFSLGDRIAAAQLAAALLGFVIVLLLLEQASRRRARFHDTTGRDRPRRGQPLRGVPAVLACAACLAPVVIGFLLPGGLLLRLALLEGDAQFGAPFIRLTRNSFILAGVTAAAAVGLAVLLAYGARLSKGKTPAALNRLVGLGHRRGRADSSDAAGPLAEPAVAGLVRRQPRPAADRRHRGAGLRLPRALPRRRPADGGRQPGEDHAGHGRVGAQPRRGRGRRPAPGASAGAAREPADGGTAGVRRRDEGTAGDAGDAAVQFRHAGHPGLRARLGRAPGGSLDRRAGHRRGGPAAGDRALAARTSAWRKPRPPRWPSSRRACCR
jgi:ABC-type sulfate transport system permease component